MVKVYIFIDDDKYLNMLFDVDFSLLLIRKWCSLIMNVALFLFYLFPFLKIQHF